MSILQELLNLRQARLDEEAIEVAQPDQLWTDNGEDSKTYISSGVYYVRPQKNSDKFEVTVEQNDERKPFATLSKADLDRSFVPMRANQTPDVEGYSQYRDIDETEAFQYDKDTVNVDLPGGAQTLNKGDYLLRKAQGTNFKYSVKSSNDFDANFTEK
jgi:hypothetical protein